MRTRNVLTSFAFIMLTLFLILIIASRTSEAGASTSPGRPAPGRTTSSATSASRRVTQTPEPTVRPTVYKPDVDITSWEFILANSEHSIGSYAPPQTGSIEGTAQYFDVRAMDALLAFIQGARGRRLHPLHHDGLHKLLLPGVHLQRRASQIAWGGTYTYEEAVEIAKTVVFYPGTSDHQTGLAVDIADRYYNSLSSANIDQDLLDWLTEHCAEYGFILRYPALKESVTGWNEPYHFPLCGHHRSRIYNGARPLPGGIHRALRVKNS